jgi:ubiquinone/menaquinone biosynthesis C-methylase UbiE
VVRALPSYRWFAWMERGAQKMLWRAVSDAVVRHGSARGPVRAPASLELDPALDLPDWYTAWDIHVQPGGVWRNDASADIYELGAKLVMLGVNDDYTFHRAFVATAVPPGAYRRIVDLGCGFGKSTWPFKKAFPGAEVIGVDLAAPCLALAAEKAAAQGLAIRFRQADCAATGLEPGSADLVTSTMLIHEMPRPHLAATLREAGRLLAPGGLLRFLDFTWTGDPFRDVAMAEHGARNNEPFMAGSMGADMETLCRAAGLEAVRWVAFDERGRGALDGLAWPPRAEWHFPWAVLEARKAA